MDCLRFLLEAPQLSQTNKKCPLPFNPCDNWCVLSRMSLTRYGTRCQRTPKSRLKIIQCIQVKSQLRCEACETGNSPHQFRDRERYVAERSRIVVTGASAGPSPSHNQRSSSQSIALSAVSPAWGDSVDPSGWYLDAQGSSDRGDPSPYTPTSPSYSLSSSPESNPERWFSSPPMGSARPHYERWVCVCPSVRLSPPDALAHVAGNTRIHLPYFSSATTLFAATILLPISQTHRAHTRIACSTTCK
jgi:hypothetical protein